MTHETKVIADEGKQELFIIREFDAPRELIFKAFTTPEILEEFFSPSPERATMQFIHHDYRPGGSYRWCNKDKNGNVLCTFYGVIHDIIAPEKIIYTSEFMEIPERGNVVTECISFEELPGGGTKLTIQDVCLNVETRDAIIKSGMGKGLVAIFLRLDELLPRLKASDILNEEELSR